MNLEQTLEKIVEHAHEELRIVRKRAEEKTAARDHGKDYHEAQTEADRLDHYAHLVRRLHDAEYKAGWRHESLNDNGWTSHGSKCQAAANSVSGRCPQAIDSS